MLRITDTRDPESTTVRLEGRLAGPWVEAFRLWWEAERATRGEHGGRLCVDLSDVAFIDASGKALLEWMVRHGVGLSARGCMTRAVRDEILLAASRMRPHLSAPGGDRTMGSAS